jgi:hypothetical protein
VCLQTEKARVGIDTGWIPPDRIGRDASEPSRFLAVEANDVVLIVHLDFVAVQLLRLSFAKMSSDSKMPHIGLI